MLPLPCCSLMLGGFFMRASTLFFSKHCSINPNSNTRTDKYTRYCFIPPRRASRFLTITRVQHSRAGSHRAFPQPTIPVTRSLALHTPCITQLMHAYTHHRHVDLKIPCCVHVIATCCTHRTHATSTTHSEHTLLTRAMM